MLGSKAWTLEYESQVSISQIDLGRMLDELSIRIYSSLSLVKNFLWTMEMEVSQKSKDLDCLLPYCGATES